jgi:hypothetical protein
MSDEDMTRAMYDEVHRLLAWAGVQDHWILDPDQDAWRDAEAEAGAAYAAWRDDPGADTFAVYRAAQDRADAAQDMLRRRSRVLHAPVTFGQRGR